MSLDLLKANVGSTFVIPADGRIAFENEPTPLPGPRLFLSGCRAGNQVVLRHDVGARTARAVEDLVANEPPWFDAASDPACLGELIALMARDTPAENVSRSMIYRLPHGLTFASETRILRSDTAEGLDWLATLAQAGMPQHLLDAGFLGAGDFWTPWCVALEGETIAAMLRRADRVLRGGYRGLHVSGLPRPRPGGGGDRGLVKPARARRSTAVLHDPDHQSVVATGCGAARPAGARGQCAGELNQGAR